MSHPSPSSSNPSRRSFIKSSTATAAGAAALASTIGSRAHAQALEEIRIALIGCGGRGTGAAEQALSTSGPIKLVAAADAFKDRLDNSVERLARSKPEQVDVPEDRRFVGFDAFRKAIDAGVDAVILATPPGFRPVHFDYAVEQGKHVFMEKPVAVDSVGVHRVLEAAKKAKEKNLKVGVGLQRHHQRSYQETLKRIQDGEIGEIIYTRVYWNGHGVWVRGRQDGQSEMEYQMRNWYYFNWLCGDHINEQHIHNIDVSNWVVGDYPVRAHGMGGREVRNGKDHGEIYDHHDVEFEYANGVRMFSQCRHIPGTATDVSEHVYGTKGYANLSGATIEPYDGRRWRYRDENPNPYQVEHDVLFEAIRENKDHNEAENGAMSTMTAIYGRYCTYSGQRMLMRDAMERGIELAPGIDDYTFDSEPPIKPDANGRYPVAVPGETEVLRPRDA